MTDDEMTKLCAAAMGWTMRQAEHFMCPHCDEYSWFYEPLTNGAQAMALVKKFNLEIQPPDPENKNWVVFHVGMAGVGPEDADLNRAIVMCVATMQQEKTPR